LKAKIYFCRVVTFHKQWVLIIKHQPKKSRMKSILNIAGIILLALLINFSLSAQTDKNLQKELTSKSIKEARQETKKLTKQGFFVARGAIPMDKQLESAWMMQLEKDENGAPKYIVETGNSTAETQTAAKIQATEVAKLSIAGNITSQIAALIEINIANQQLNNDEAASVTKIVGASKNLIAQELGRTLVVVEMYRKIGVNTEADIRLAYDLKSAKDVAKKVIRKQLEDQTKILQDRLDKIMDIK